MVANVARSLGALTIGVVTRPFGFEGKRRGSQAETGIERLREEVDTLIVIPNDRLLSISDRQVSVLDAFKAADQVLLSGVQGITDLITTPGLINLDFADVKSVMSGAGSALMGIGSARGDDRSVAAAETAISSPLLEASIDGAHGVLLSIQGGSDLGLFEINEAAQLVSNSAAPDANFIFGAVIDDALGDEVRVTVIAAGLGDNRSRGALPEVTARVLSGRRESNGHASVSAGQHGAAPGAAPGYQVAAAAQPAPAASQGARPTRRTARIRRSTGAMATRRRQRSPSALTPPVSARPAPPDSRTAASRPGRPRPRLPGPARSPRLRVTPRPPSRTLSRRRCPAGLTPSRPPASSTPPARAAGRWSSRRTTILTCPTS